MGLAAFRVILTFVVAVFLVCIIGADDSANAGAGLVRNDGCDGSVTLLRLWGSELCFTHGVTAALFALAAAALLFIFILSWLHYIRAKAARVHASLDHSGHWETSSTTPSDAMRSSSSAHSTSVLPGTGSAPLSNWRSMSIDSASSVAEQTA